MPAYTSSTLSEFVSDRPSTLVSRLHSAYASDGFSQQYTSQTRAWDESVPLIQQELRRLLSARPAASDWRMLLEFPLYRLRRRIDLVILTGHVVAVVELKRLGRRLARATAEQLDRVVEGLKEIIGS